MTYIIINEGQFTEVDDIIQLQIDLDTHTWNDIVTNTVDAYIKLRTGKVLYGLSEADNVVLEGVSNSLLVILDPQCNNLMDEINTKIDRLIKESVTSQPQSVTVGDISDGSALPPNFAPQITVVKMVY